MEKIIRTVCSCADVYVQESGKKWRLPRKEKKALKKWVKENSYFIKGSDELFKESEMIVI
tara:strand:- start:158 stop:337 length:180 start_codon:yes stop_codon:yes gene_type:complete